MKISFKYNRAILLLLPALVIFLQIYQAKPPIVTFQSWIMRQCINLGLQRLIYNVMSIGRIIIRCFLSTSSINKIDLYAASIELQISTIILDFGHSNPPKSILYMEKLVAGQQIILNRSVRRRKRSLMTVTLILRLGQFLNEIYNPELSNMKLLTMINV